MRPKSYMLAKAIQERKEILFGNVDAMFKPQGLKEKEEAWEAVRIEMIEGGFTNFERKSWKDVRNHDWQYLRRSTVAKFEHNKKSTCDPIQYSEVDKIVFDIMGNEESFFNDKVFDAEGKSFVEGNIDSGLMENLLAAAFKPPCSCVDSSINNEIPSTSCADENIIKNNDTNNNSGYLETNLLNNNSEPNCTSNLKSLLNNITNRKMSWDTNSSNESNKDHAKDKNLKIFSGITNDCESTQDYSKLLPISPNSNFKAVNSSGSNVLSHLELLNGLNGMLEKSVYSSTNQRKRPYVDTTRTKSIEEEQQEAKLQIFFIQAKREELLLQQEQAKLDQELAKARQEQAKARQEQTKAELLEIKLLKKRKKSIDAS